VDANIPTDTSMSPVPDPRAISLPVVIVDAHFFFFSWIDDLFEHSRRDDTCASRACKQTHLAASWLSNCVRVLRPGDRRRISLSKPPQRLTLLLVDDLGMHTLRPKRQSERKDIGVASCLSMHNRPILTVRTTFSTATKFHSSTPHNGRGARCTGRLSTTLCR
jgi:hypothetical protein